MKLKFLLLFLFSAGIAQAQLSITPGGTVGGSSILFTPDNTYNIGASGANRPASIFVANNVIAGGTVIPGSLNINSQCYFSTAGDGNLNLRISSTANSGFGILSLGGTSSSWPGIKRDGTGMDARLADD